jgi:hypothetical protein
MTKKKEENDLKVREILGSVSTYGADIGEDLSNVMTNIKIYTSELMDKYNNIRCGIFVDDTSKVKWQSQEHFTKVFDDEIRYCKDKYGLTRNEISFLRSLGEFLLWEINMLVDNNNLPLNQKSLADLLDISPKTVQRNMKTLEEKKCIFSIPLKTETFYVVNPFLLYRGSKINLILPALFTDIGYIPLKVTRKHRKKIDEKDAQTIEN